MRKNLSKLKRSELTPDELAWVRKTTSEYAREWRKSNGARVNAKLRDRYKTDSEYRQKVLSRFRVWEKKNWQRNLSRKKRRYHEVDKHNIQYVIRNNTRRRLRLALLRGNSFPVDSALRLCGCSVPDLMAHLQSQFKEGMHWNNYGKWHIDHIRPCASFDLTDPEKQRQCFHYSNLQPLWAKENLSKGAKLITT
jgi:hypothetical protein